MSGNNLAWYNRGVGDFALFTYATNAVTFYGAATFASSLTAGAISGANVTSTGYLNMNAGGTTNVSAGDIVIAAGKFLRGYVAAFGYSLIGITTTPTVSLDPAGLGVICGGPFSAGTVAIGNTVTAGIAVASTHKVAMLIGGVQYYLLASNV
jgi:hypothetical protein